MAKSKPIYGVWFCGGGTISGTGMQPVKANDDIEAKRKFLKKHPKLNEEDNILDVAVIEPGGKNYLLFKSQAI